MTTQTCCVSLDILEPFVVDVFKGMGVPEADARVCADVIVTADKRGIGSHGIGRLKPIYYDRVLKDKIQSPVTNFEIVSDRKTAAVVDGHHGMGMVISRRCTEMAIAKAREYGTGVVVARNSTHFGIAAYYSLMAADAGMIGFTSTNARPSIAPTFGVEPLMGTNPLVFAVPTDEPFPFTNDYSPAIAQRGKVEQYAREGKPLDPSWVIDRNCKPMTEAQEVLKALTEDRASLVPIGGIAEETGSHKGYGFLAVAEILSASLQQGAFLKQLMGFEGGKKAPHRLGHFFMAINIEFFTDLASFKKTTGDILRQLRNSKKAPGQKKIYTHGEKEYLAWQDRTVNGIPVDPELQKQLIAMRNELKLSQYKFPFE